MLKITVLVDNNSRINHYLTAEPALSLWLEVDDQRFLFDTGYSDAYLINSAKLGLDLTAVNAVVLSHGHNDHTGGLKYWIRRAKCPLVAAEGLLDPKFDEKLGVSYGCALTLTELQTRFDLKLVTKPHWLTPHLLFLGPIPHNASKDREDSALAYVTPEGLVIVTGCSHAGLLNILQYALAVTQARRVQAVIGGLHLLNAEANTLQTIGEFLNAHQTILHPMHCCDLAARIALSHHCPVREACTGDTLVYP